MNGLDGEAIEFARSLVSESQGNNVVFGHVLTLLEHFKFQVHKLKSLGYCDDQAACFCFKTSQVLVDLSKSCSKKSTESFISSIEKTMETLYDDYLKVANSYRSKLAPNDDLHQRLKNLKCNKNSASGSYLNKDFFKSRDLISAQELNHVMRQSPGQVLLIDFRTRKEFEYSHINYSPVVNIEPRIVKEIVNSDVEASDRTLESALSSAIDAASFKTFERRQKFDLIVFYNLRYGLPDCVGKEALKHALATGKTSPLLTSNPFNIVIDLITYKFQYLSTKIQQYPLILNGGLETWYQSFGEAGLTHIVRKGSKNSDSSGSEAPGSSFGNPKYHKNFGDYFSSGLSQNLIFESTKISEKPVGHFEWVASSSQKQLTASDSGRELFDVNLGKNKKEVPMKVEIDTLSIMTGLTNLGNSCYMNCILQCLAATPPLFDFFMGNLQEGDSGRQLYKKHINFSNALGTKGIVTSEFVDLLTNMSNGSGAVFTPIKFKKVIGSVSPGKQFATRDQQDCIEFLNFILDSLHEDLNQRSIDSPKERAMIMDLSSEQESARESLPIRLASTIEWERYLKLNFSIVVDYFQGQYSSQLKCLECNLTSTTFNAFSILSLPIPEKLNGAAAISLSDCLDLFLETELLDDSNKWHCPRCKKFTKSTKKITITRLPRVLIIHFKRFKIHAGNFKKLESFVTYPVDETLDMTNYWPSVGSYMNSSVKPIMDEKTEREYLSSFPLRHQVTPFKYRLYGVANHYGNLTNGHYTSYVKKKKQSNKSEWCYFDDARVTYNVKSKDVLSASAYCLFYSRI